MKSIKSELLAMGELLRHTIEGRNLSHREVQRRVCQNLKEQSGEKAQTLGSTIRVKLRKGNEWRLSFEELLLILEAIEVDSAEFLATLAKVGRPSLALFGPVKKDHWTQEQRRILREVAALGARGSEGYLEARAELKAIELQRDENPQKAEAAAWAFLERNRQPGALVGALAILAVEAPCGNAQRLFRIAFDLLGKETNSSAAGFKVVTSMGRCLYVLGFYEEALEVLDKQALRLAGLFGTVDEIAMVNYYTGHSASRLGDAGLSRRCFEQCFALGSDRWRFAALQHMAVEEMNGGDIAKAAEMYDELVCIPFFEVASPRARASVRWSRLTAHFLFGGLNSRHEEEFRQAVDEARSLLDPCNRILASLDLSLFLQSIGKAEAARELLEAEVWHAVNLENLAIQEKFAGQWISLGLPSETLKGWFNRTGAKIPQPHPPASPPCRGRAPKQ